MKYKPVIAFIFVLIFNLNASEAQASDTTRLALVARGRPEYLFNSLQSLVSNGQTSDSEFAREISSAPPKGPDQLQMCGDPRIGVKFLCNPSWKMQVSDEAMIIVISEAPDVSMIVARMPSRYFSLEQMTVADLFDLNQYAPGFIKEKARLAGREAVMIKAFSREAEPRPQKRVLDYFMIKDKMLYTLLFSIRPKEKWDDYKFLIKDITDSFMFY